MNNLPAKFRVSSVISIKFPVNSQQMKNPEGHYSAVLMDEMVEMLEDWI